MHPFPKQSLPLSGPHPTSHNLLPTPNNLFPICRYGIGADEVCRLYSVDDSAVLRDWDVDTGQCIASMPAHELGIKCVVARDGLVMTGSLDMSVKIWDASSFSCAATLDCVGDSVMRLEIVAGNWLLAAG